LSNFNAIRRNTGEDKKMAKIKKIASELVEMGVPKQGIVVGRQLSYKIVAMDRLSLARKNLVNRWIVN